MQSVTNPLFRRRAEKSRQVRRHPYQSQVAVEKDAGPPKLFDQLGPVCELGIRGFDYHAKRIPIATLLIGPMAQSPVGAADAWHTCHRPRNDP